MLEALCGNKNIQKILIFLFVNGKCYGTQLHKSLNTSLTPLQKALSRLEKGGIISSYYQGKTRLYHFNPTYPLLSELEVLLKKAYTLLPMHLKKEYYVSKNDFINDGISPQKKSSILIAFWKKLSSVKQLTFIAKTKSKKDIGWDGKGKGEVSITKNTSNIFVFTEKGSWQNTQGIELGFTNVFRWTLDLAHDVIALEHLRRGLDFPVFLFHLTPSGPNSLSSVDSHLCGSDTYFGQIHFDQNNFRLHWRVIGPKKNEEIDYYYF